MIDLDKKVFGRDSILIAAQNLPSNYSMANEQQLGGFFKKLKKKLKKVRKKLSKVVRKIPGVKNVYKAVNKFESKNRKGLKKLGGIAAVAVAAYFGGPYVMKFASSMGGSTLARFAGSKGVQSVVGGIIQRRYTPPQIQQMQEYATQQTPAQLFQNPYMQEVQQYAAQEYAQQMQPNNPGAQYLAQEGAFEVGHQIEKGIPQKPTSAKAPSFLTGETAKILLPAALAILTVTLINR